MLILERLTAVGLRKEHQCIAEQNGLKQKKPSVLFVRLEIEKSNDSLLFVSNLKCISVVLPL